MSCSTTKPSAHTIFCYRWPQVSSIHKKGASVCTNANVLLRSIPLQPLMINQKDKLQACVTESLSLPVPNTNQMFSIHEHVSPPSTFSVVLRLGNKVQLINRTFSINKDGVDNLKCWSGPTIINSIKWHGYYIKQEQWLKHQSLRIIIPNLLLWVHFLVYKMEINNLGFACFLHSDVVPTTSVR